MGMRPRTTSDCLACTQARPRESTHAHERMFQPQTAAPMLPIPTQQVHAREATAGTCTSMRGASRSLPSVEYLGLASEGPAELISREVRDDHEKRRHRRLVLCNQPGISHCDGTQSTGMGAPVLLCFTQTRWPLMALAPRAARVGGVALAPSAVRLGGTAGEERARRTDLAVCPVVV